MRHDTGGYDVGQIWYQYVNHFREVVLTDLHGILTTDKWQVRTCPEELQGYYDQNWLDPVGQEDYDFRATDETVDRDETSTLRRPQKHYKTPTTRRLKENR
jgi:hypothetical protein